MTESARLYYEERGQGMPVVLLHGFPFDHTIWSAQSDALSESVRVIAPDLRGHGQSPVFGEVYDMAALAADVVAVLDRCGVDRAVWVGHSMGGYITMAALREFPDRVAGIGLVATHPHPDTPEKRIQRNQSAQQVLGGGAGQVVLSMMNVLFAPALDRKSELAQRIYDVMLRTKTEGLAGALRAMAERPDSANTLATTTVPAVVIAGAEDQIVSVEVMQAMADLLTGAECHVIDRAGHMVMVENPAATTAALRAFLNRFSAA